MKTWRPGEDDEFDSTIDGEWRKASHEEPGPHVDAAILAAARTRRPRFVTWQPLAAAAAVAGLSFLLVQLLPSGRELEQPIRIESQQPAAVPAEQPGATAKATTQGCDRGGTRCASNSRERDAGAATAGPDVGSGSAARDRRGCGNPIGCSPGTAAVVQGVASRRCSAAGAPAPAAAAKEPLRALNLHLPLLRLERCRQLSGRR